MPRHNKYIPQTVPHPGPEWSFRHSPTKGEIHEPIMPFSLRFQAAPSLFSGNPLDFFLAEVDPTKETEQGQSLSW